MSIEVAFVLRNEAATFTSKLFLLIAVENVCVGVIPAKMVPQRYGVTYFL